MPAGDSQRKWFPEMVDELRSRWSKGMSLEELISLTRELDEMLQEIRTQRKIKPVMMWCPKCQKRQPSAPPRVSVRSVIFALGRFGIASSDTVSSLEKHWKKYRKEHELDLRGTPAGVAEDDHHHDAVET